MSQPESKTPRTDAATVNLDEVVVIDKSLRKVITKYVPANIAQELETELAAATARIAELEAEKALVNSHIAELESTVRTDNNVCPHGQLARSCEICERDAEIHKLKTQHAYEANGLRALLQNERDHMAAALLEIDRMKKLVAHRNGEIVMAGLKVAELEDEINRLREYCRPCDIEAAARSK